MKRILIKIYPERFKGLSHKIDERFLTKIYPERFKGLSHEIGEKNFNFDKKSPRALQGTVS
jgi:hypothetical protein